MVVGIRKSLEPGKTYTYGELSQRLGLRGRPLEGMIDRLMECGCLVPVVFKCTGASGGAVGLAGRFEHQLNWQA